MRNLKLLMLLVALAISSMSFGQLSGTKTIPGDYATIAAAITDLNTVGVAAPGVTFNVAAGYTETFATSIAGLITATGTTPNDQIIFQKSGSGANPIITAGVGTSTTIDGIIVIKGGNYITFDGIDLQENALNTTATQQMEWGYALVKSSATDGAQNNNIKNCAITLNKTNTATIGIYLGNHTDANTTSIVVTAVDGANSNNKVNGNTISNVFYGIYFKGYADAPPYAFYDQNNEIGVTTGNTISNYGGASSCAGIYVTNNNLTKISNNNISTTTSNTLRGIYLSGGTNVSIDVLTNTITLTSTASTSQLTGIESAIPGTTNTINLNNNIIQNCTYTTATSGNFYGIYNNGASSTVNINGNAIINNTLSGTGSFYGVETGSPITVNVNSNVITNNIRTTTTTGTTYCIKTTNPTTINVSNNTIDGNNFTGAGTTGTIYGFYSNNSAVTVNLTSNIIRNLSVNGAGSIYGIYEYGSSTAAPKSFLYNQIYNFSTSAGASTMSGIRLSAGTTNFVTNNVIYSFNSIGGTSGSFYGIWVSSGTTNNINYNNIYNIATSSTNPSLYGVYLAGGTTNNVYNNYVSDLRTTAANAGIPLAGIYASSGTTNNIFYNTIYLNTVSTGALFGSAGIYASTTPTVDLRNNIIVNTSTPMGATGYTAAYRRSGTTLTTYSANSNNNCFYAGTPSANNLIYYDGTNFEQTIAGFQTRMLTRDVFSFSELPPFQNIATTPYNLHLQTTLATKCESGGIRITSPAITDDFDGNVRWGETGYTGTGSTTDVGADEFNGIPSYTCAAPAPGNTIASATSICNGQSVNLSLQNATIGTGLSYKWQSSSNGTVYTDITGATASTYSATPTDATYYQCIVTCMNGPATATSTPVQITFPNSVVSTTGGSRCGTGVVSLAATGSAGTTLNWYDAQIGGTNIGTGSPINTPIISATTTYYVGAETPLNINAGRITPTATSSDYWTNYGLVFNTTNDITINTVDVYPVNTTPANMTIKLLNNLGTQVAGTSDIIFMPIAGTGTTAQTITLNYNVPAGTGYRLVISSGMSTSNKLVQETTGYTYPITSAPVSITSNWNGSSTGTNYYDWFYNWSITTSCSSPRKAVVATIGASPALTLTTNQTVCNNVIATVSVTSTLTDYDSYVWTPVTDLYTDATATTPYVAGANATTVYLKSTTAGAATLTCTANNTSTMCSNVTTSVVTVSAITPNPTATNTTVSVCQGATSALLSTISGPQTIIVPFDVTVQPTETNAAPGNIVASATIPALPAGATITSVTLSYPGITALESSYRSEVRLGLSGSVLSNAAAGTGAASSSGLFDYTRIISNSAVNLAGGIVNLLYWDSSNDNTGDEATFPTGNGVATLTIIYTPAPTNISWYDAATAGNLLANNASLEAVGTTVLPNTNTAGTYNFYAENVAGTCPSSPRLHFTVTVNPLPSTPTANNSIQCGVAVPTCSVTSTTGAISPVFNWYDVATGGTPIAGITGNTYTGAAINTTTHFYVSEFNGTCESARVDVTANVNTPDAITASINDGDVCLGTSVDLSVSKTGTTNTYAYVWSATPETGSGITGTTTGSTTTVTPTLAGSYTYNVTATDATLGCVANSTISLVVNANPANVGIVASQSTITCGSTIDLTAVPASGNITLLNETFNGATNNWTKTNTSTGGTPALADWTLRADGYSYGSFSTVTFHSNDNSQFYLSNSDEQGSGGVANTTLESPSFSTIGINSLSLSFFHYYRFYSSTGNVEIWNGTTWTSVKTYTATVGAATAFTQETIDLASYVGLSDVKIRFTYNASYGYYWAIDNVVVSAVNPTYTYAWASVPASLNATTQTVTGQMLTGTTDYTVTITNTANCSATANTTVTVNPLPAPTVTIENLCGNSNLTASGYTGNLTWNTSETTATINVTTGGDYNVIQSLNGCTSANTTANAAPIAIPTAPTADNVVACEGSIPDLTATGTGTINWYSDLALTVLEGTGSPFATGKTATGVYTYYVNATANTCSGPATTVTLTINATPTVTITASNNPTACGLSDGDATVSAGSSYAWNTTPVQTTQQATGLAAGSYTVTVSDGTCSNTATVVLSDPGAPTVTLSANDTTICAGTSVTFTAGGATTYEFFVNAVSQGTASTTNTFISTTLANNDIVTVNGTTTGCTGTSTSVTMIVNTPAAVTITESNGVLTSSANTGNQWYNAAGIIADSTNQTIAPTATDDYYVIVTDANGCTVTSNTIHFIYTSVNNLSQVSDVKVFPNPNNGIFNLVVTAANDQNITMELRNIQGQIIFNKHVKANSIYKESFDFSNLAKGVYYLNVNNGSSIKVSKVVIK